jgi:hypothetical protein
MIETQTEIRVMPAGHAIAVVLVALVFGLVLNAPDIRATADRQEAGWKRELAVAAIQPFEWFSRTFRFNVAHNVIDLALGRANEPVEPAAITTTTVASVGQATTTTTATFARRSVTVDAPLRMFIGGDSMVGQFGPMLENRAEESGLVDVTEVIYEFSSGLTRPDFLDWPVRLRQVRSDQAPDVMVLFFGGNDGQAIEIDEIWFDFGSPEWLAEYRTRVRSLMEELDGAGRDVYWMGLPIVRQEEFRQKVEIMNDIYRSEADEFDLVTYVDSWAVFTGPDGGYSEYLTDDSGDLVDMRLNDGIHLTTAGAIRLAKVTFEVIAENWDLP